MAIKNEDRTSVLTKRKLKMGGISVDVWRYTDKVKKGKKVDAQQETAKPAAKLSPGELARLFGA